MVLVLLTVGTRTLPAQPESDIGFPSAPPSDGFITDLTGLLDESALARLNGRILTIQQRTGGDVGVVLLRDLKDRAPADVGVAIYRAWAIGRGDSIGSSRRALGALLLIVPKEVAPSGKGECWITTGRGAEAELHDADAGGICRSEVIPELREKRYESAVAAGIDAIGAFFEETTVGPVPLSGGGAGRPRRRGNPGLLFWLLSLVGGAAGLGGAALLVRHWRRVRPRACPNGHGDMQRLSETADDAVLLAGQRTEEQLGSVDYDVWACSACEERVVISYKRWSSYEGCPNCGFQAVKRSSRTLEAATVTSTGLERIELDCRNCDFHDVTRRVTPRVTPASSGSGFSGGGGGGGGGGSSFGGSGSTGGGGGGSSY